MVGLTSGAMQVEQAVRVVTVRYFASVAAATGRDEEELELAVRAAEATVGDVVSAVIEAHPEVERLVALCSVLAGGRVLTDPHEPLGDAQVVDVLPPFAGG